MIYFVASQILEPFSSDKKSISSFLTPYSVSLSCSSRLKDSKYQHYKNLRKLYKYDP